MKKHVSCVVNAFPITFQRLFLTIRPGFLFFVFLCRAPKTFQILVLRTDCWVPTTFVSCTGQHSTYCEAGEQSWLPMWWYSCLWYFRDHEYYSKYLFASALLWNDFLYQEFVWLCKIPWWFICYVFRFLKYGPRKDVRRSFIMLGLNLVSLARSLCSSNCIFYALLNVEYLSCWQSIDSLIWSEFI